MGLQDEIKKELDKSHSISEIKSNLIRRGYLESDIDDVLSEDLVEKFGARIFNLFSIFI